MALIGKESRRASVGSETGRIDREERTKCICLAHVRHMAHGVGGAEVLVGGVGTRIQGTSVSRFHRWGPNLA